ncbi:MAG: hypothetical protein K2G47_00490 [Muribaculum sp.]|nr:hypothetical protein [Muribaculum sp.]
MKTRIYTTLITALTGTCIAMAQSTGGSFADFRKGLLEGYNSYRNGVLERYDKFLDGVWTDFEQFKGEESNPVPKPERVPTVGDTPTPASATPPAETPKPIVAQTPKPVPAPQPESKPTPVSRPAQPAATVPAGNYDFSFYGMPVSVPSIDVHVTNRISSPRDFGAQWREFTSNDHARRLIDELTAAADKMTLNDYLRYELVTAYVDSRYSSSPITSRMALKHFLLVGMGYNVRIGLSGSNAVLLIPFKQTVYARTYMMVDGKKFYVFTDKSVDPQAILSMRISTCELPKNAETGNSMDLRMSGLNLPYKPHKYDLKFKDITLSGEVNANIFPVLYNYPQMPTADFARSSVLADVRKDIVNQFKTQLEGKDELDAVNTLLQFVQGAFEYATDEAFHGFEKPYFFEELLYYPKCDCEDRAIFYTYLLWNVLGLENQLINFPGHESASVKLSQPIKGDAYVHDGTTYYISDPTYIGSVTGMCMPTYSRENPGVDFTYK